MTPVPLGHTNINHDDSQISSPFTTTGAKNNNLNDLQSLQSLKDFEINSIPPTLPPRDKVSYNTSSVSTCFTNKTLESSGNNNNNDDHIFKQKNDGSISLYKPPSSSSSPTKEHFSFKYLSSSSPTRTNNSKYLSSSSPTRTNNSKYLSSSSPTRTNNSKYSSSSYTNNTISTSVYKTSEESQGSRRQRVLSYIKSRKDEYWKSFDSTNTSSNVPEFNESDLQITLYPSYTRKLGNLFQTEVRLLLSVPSEPNRKSRIAISILKQIIGSPLTSSFMQPPVDRGKPFSSNDKSKSSRIKFTNDTKDKRIPPFSFSNNSGMSLSSLNSTESKDSSDLIQFSDDDSSTVLGSDILDLYNSNNNTYDESVGILQNSNLKSKNDYTNKFKSNRNNSSFKSQSLIKSNLYNKQSDKTDSFDLSLRAKLAFERRLAPFYARPIANLPLSIDLQASSNSESNGISEISSKEFVNHTNEQGRVDRRFVTSFLPSSISVEYNGGSFAVEDTYFIDEEGISVISDIDDTVKVTGIIGERKEMFKNVFIRSPSECRIEGVKEWYNKMDQLGVRFHYVSNAPWQLFNYISKAFLDLGLPKGSIHLKLYNGIFDSLLEPASEKKRETLNKLFLDFPHRKFILIGDSGEGDLEIYVEMAIKFRRQVLAIYIRDVTTLNYNNNNNNNNNNNSNSQLADNNFDNLLIDIPPPDTIDLISAGSVGYESVYGKKVAGALKSGISYSKQLWSKPLVPDNLNGKQNDNFIYEDGDDNCTESSNSDSNSRKRIFSKHSRNSSFRELGESTLSVIRKSKMPTSLPKVPFKPIRLRSHSLHERGVEFDLIDAKTKSTISGKSDEHSAKENKEIDIKKEDDLQMKPELPPRPSDLLLDDEKYNNNNNNNNISRRNKKTQGINGRGHERQRSLPFNGFSGTSSSSSSSSYDKPISKTGTNSFVTFNDSIDKKAELWRRRTLEAREILPPNIKLRMWRNGWDVMSECEAIIHSERSTILGKNSMSTYEKLKGLNLQ